MAHISSFFRATAMCLLLCVGLLSPVVSHASLSDQINEQLDTAGASSSLKTSKEPGAYLGGFIQILLSLFGMLFLVLLIYAGYLRLTAHGDEDRVKKSNKTIVAAILGTTIVLLAYSITAFILPRIYNATTQDPRYDVNDRAPDNTYEASVNLDIF